MLVKLSHWYKVSHEIADTVSLFKKDCLAPWNIGNKSSSSCHIGNRKVCHGGSRLRDCNSTDCDVRFLLKQNRKFGKKHITNYFFDKKIEIYQGSSINDVATGIVLIIVISPSVGPFQSYRSKYFYLYQPMLPSWWMENILKQKKWFL